MNNEPEYLTPRLTAQKFNIGITSLYSLMKRGKIKSLILNIGGKQKNVGKRLISVQSVRDYLVSETQTQYVAGNCNAHSNN